MKVNLPLMIQDPMTARAGTNIPVEGIDVIAAEDGRDFLDGPVTPKVAVLDFDPVTGVLAPGARFEPALNRGKAGYEFSRKDLYSPAFIQVSLLGAILKTMRMFEKPGVLGRKISWAFDGPQLLVVPRAGEWANAFYERSSRSLQFFWFKSPKDPKKIVYTSLSRDIVAHETGHAIIDGIAPALYDAVTPQSLALHEALADLTALMTAVGSSVLRSKVLAQTEGDIKDSEVFSSLAPEFGDALDISGANPALRNLRNDTKLQASMHEPHELSTVLSGALYALLMFLYQQVWSQQDREFSKSGYALAVAAILFERLVFRAIDFMPPGETSFADYGRALVAAERSATGTVGQEIDALKDEFVQRGIVESGEELEVIRTEWPHLRGIDFGLLLESDSEAYEFVNNHRELLRIPAGVPFRLAPRYHTRKNSKPDKNTDRFKEELILKVSWEVSERHDFDPEFPTTRKVTCGTTLVLDWKTGAIETILTADLPRQKAARDAMVARLFEDGLLEHPAQRPTGYGSPMLAVDVRSGALRIDGAARLLHLQGRGS